MSDVEFVVLVRKLPRRRLPVRSVRWLEERPRDRCGRPRSPITLPEFRRGRKPGNYGKRYPPEPLTAPEVIALMDACPTRSTAGRRNRALIVTLWRVGARINEALHLELRDFDPVNGTIHIRTGKGGKSRVVGIDPGAWAELTPWLMERAELPLGPVFCVVEGPTRGMGMRAAYFRTMLKHLATKAGITKNVRPHGFRHSLACDLAREGVPIHVISRHLGHSNVGTTSQYLAGIAPVEVIGAIHARAWPGSEQALGLSAPGQPGKEMDVSHA